MDARLAPSAPWQARIRSINQANGWTVPTRGDEWPAIVARLTLAITEVAEAIEVVRKLPVDDLHLAEELADIVIRLFDLGEGLGIQVFSGAEQFTSHEREVHALSAIDLATADGMVVALGIVAARIARAVTICIAPDVPVLSSELAPHLAIACIQVQTIADHRGLDLVPAIEAKLVRNATRGYRHGGRAV